MPNSDVENIPLAFQIAFERLKASVTYQDQLQFSLTTLKDVETAARDIEKQLAARQSLQNLRRISPLLRFLAQYSAALDTLCNGTPFLPWIWAPIKLMLQVACAYPEAFEKLLEAYAQIGECMPRLDRLNKAFKDNSRIQEVLSFIYEDVLEFHRRAYKFFRRSGWRIFFDATWTSFDSRFKGIIQRLEKHRDLLDKEAVSAQIVEAKAWREKMQYELDRQDIERTSAQFQNALSWLDSRDNQEDNLDRYLEHTTLDTCNWIVDKPKMESWLENDNEKHVLWLRGIPGAGKSTLAAYICQHIRTRAKHRLLFHFCTTVGVDQNYQSQMLKSLISQLLRLEQGLSIYVLQKYVYKGLTPSISQLKLLLQDMLLSSSSIRLIIDGLDEWDEKDQGKVLSSLFPIARTEASCICKVMLVSRETPTIERLLRKKPTIDLGKEQGSVNSSIRRFVEVSMIDVREKFEEHEEHLIDKIMCRIVEKAGGMFLWVKLIMDGLLEVHSMRELEIAVDDLPAGLKAIYRRIIDRMLGSLSSPNRLKAMRILQWIAFSYRPLRVFEILDAIFFDNPDCILDERTKFKDSILGVCKPLIEVRAQSLVAFVHVSAREYLLDRYSGPVLEPAKSQVTIATSCVSYLCFSSRVFGHHASEDSALHSVVSGCHGLQRYANEYWLKHSLAVAKLLESQHNTATREILAYSLRTLVQQNQEWQFRPDTVTAAVVEESIADVCIKDLPPEWNVGSLAQQVLSFRRTLIAQGGNKIVLQDGFLDLFGLKEDPTMFSKLLQRYDILSKRLMSANAAEVSVDGTKLRSFKRTYGINAYTCRFRLCSNFSDGFPTKGELEKHEQLHIRRFECVEPKCAFYGHGFKTLKALRSHNGSYHTDKANTDYPRHVAPVGTGFELGGMDPSIGVGFANALDSGDIFDNFDLDELIRENSKHELGF